MMERVAALVAALLVAAPLHAQTEEARTLEIDGGATIAYTLRQYPPEATRAVAAALPFFTAAEQVIVLRVEEEEWFAPTEDLEAYLTRHGVRAIDNRVLPKDPRTGRSLLIGARDVAADMMVMGAYTRSKLRQMILGSVTGFVLEHATLPVLLCH